MVLKQITTKLDKQIKLRSTKYISIVCLLMVVFLGATNYIIGVQIVLPTFYLVPISVVTWYVGNKAGKALTILISIIWLTIDPLIRTIHSSLYFYWNVLGRAGLFLIYIYILSLLKDSWIRENELAREDPLTGVANRRYFFEVLENEIIKAQRYKHPITIGYLDVDDFKLINDSLGHVIGDKLLCMVAQTIQGELRRTDVVARLGGDEFAILLPETGQLSAQIVCSRIQSKLLENMKENNWSVTFSIGVYILNSPLSDIDELMAKVDMAMYSVKNNTKSAICYQSDEADY